MTLDPNELTKIELRDVMLSAYETKLKEMLRDGRITMLDYGRFDKAHITIALPVRGKV